MKPRLTRHVALSLYKDAAAVTATATALVAGLHTLLDDGPTLAGRFAELAPVALGPLLLVATAMTLGRFREERSLAALSASGLRASSVAAAVVLAAVPVVLLAAWWEATPPRWGATERVHDDERPSRRETLLAALEPDVESLADGGFLVRLGTSGLARRPAAALIPAEPRLVFGTEPVTDAGRADDERRLRVHETWWLDGRAAAREVHDAPRLWTGRVLTAPRELLWGEDADTLALAEIDAWLALEPDRDDLRFARDRRLCAGPRVLVLLLLGLGPWLRAAITTRRDMALGAWAAIGGYVLVETWSATLGVTGRIPPTLAAAGPTLVFGALALVGLARADRPS